MLFVSGKRLNSRFGASLHISSNPQSNNTSQNTLLIGSPRHSNSNTLGMGDGTVYTFSNFFLGTMSDKCKESDTAPCPEESADLNYVPDEGDERSLFGQAIASTKIHNFVSAPKSSTYARQSGVIYVYKN